MSHLRLFLLGLQFGPVLQIGAAIESVILFLLFHAIKVRVDAVGALDAHGHGEEVMTAQVLRSAGLMRRFKGARGEGGVAVRIRAAVGVRSAV